MCTWGKNRGSLVKSCNTIAVVQASCVHYGGNDQEKSVTKLMYVVFDSPIVSGIFISAYRDGEKKIIFWKLKRKCYKRYYIVSIYDRNL